ncbi:MAG: phage tail tape measure protein [Bacteroides fragilis]|nr:phage tail tape measure protein [Bacteroides fragilis]
MEENFLLELIGCLDQNKSKKQINADIKQLEKVINMLRLTGTFAKADTKKELNTYIAQLSNQLSAIKLKAKIDNKNLKSEINSALNNVSFKDIDALNIDGNKTKLKVQKVIADTKTFVEKNPIVVGINISYKKNKLDNDLTAYLNRNSKISESRVLLEEADKVRDLIDTVTDKKSLTEATDAFRLFKSEVSATGYTSKSTADKIKSMLGHITKIGSAFGVASMLINNFTKSLKTLRSNDTILTEISKTSEMTKNQLKELGDEAFKVASKFGQLSSNYLLSVQEMARSGYEDISKELGELSLLAQSAGDMTVENANNYLLATDAAYKYSGSVEKLNAALDGANYISNKNSASLTDIADATRVSASFAANAGIAIDELTAAEATMIAATKRSGSEIGRSFRSIILNLQQVSGEFEGEIIDEEQLKKVEERCHSLGVELEYMKDGVATLRNPIEILKDLAEVYNSLPDSSAEKQGLIADLGGKYHANALSALLSQWDLYEKMLSEFSQGAGSALEEAEKTANSWEGRLNSLQNSWDSFINTLTNKDAIMGGISFFDRLIQGAEKLTDSIGEIPVVLTTLNTAMVAMKKDYGITQLVKSGDKETRYSGKSSGNRVHSY